MSLPEVGLSSIFVAPTPPASLAGQIVVLAKVAKVVGKVVVKPLAEGPNQLFSHETTCPSIVATT